MNINKYIKNIWVAACILMGGTLFNSCTDELDGKSVINTGTEGINLTISVDGMREKVLTRASERKDKSEIHDLHIILASGDDIKKVFSVESTETGSDQSETSTGLESDPSFDTGELSYHISQEDAKGADHVYVVANYEDFATNDENDKPISIDDLNTVADLKGLKVKYLSGVPYCPMFGDVALGGNTDAHGHSNGSTYSVELKRTLAMITVGIDCREGDDNVLHKGVMITPTSIALKNVPATCVLGANNTPDGKEEEGGIIVTDGESYSNLGWATLTSDQSQAFTPDDPHSIASDVIPLFMFENMQGTDSSIGKEEGKDDESSSSTYATYIEVQADYEYHSGNDANAPENIPSVLKGTITYKFYLGENVIDNFDVKRNVHYQLTLCLKDWAGLKEDGKIEGDRYVEGNTDEVGWRVDTDLEEIGQGEFVDDVIDIPVAGCRFNVTVAADEELQFHRGSDNSLFVRGSDGEWKNPSSGNLQPKDMDILDNGDGTYTYFFYAKPLMTFAKASSLTTEEDWIKNGYEDLVEDGVYIKEGGNNRYLTVRRWYPLPVMDPADLNGSTNPNNAKLYYSRFDIANGEELPWGPSAYDNVELNSEGSDHGQLEVDGLNIIDPYGAAGSYRTFNPKYGFHNQVAFFKTVQRDGNEDALNFSAVINDNTDNESNYGTYTIMDFAIFTSANAEDPVSEGTNNSVIVSAGDVKHQHRYALASKEEWAKIEKWGAKDPDHSVLPVSYWTSNMEGTQSYVYIYGSGGKTDLRDRSEPYRGRMVYHINNDAEF